MKWERYASCILKSRKNLLRATKRTVFGRNTILMILQRKYTRQTQQLFSLKCSLYLLVCGKRNVHISTYWVVIHTKVHMQACTDVQ